VRSDRRCRRHCVELGQSVAQAVKTDPTAIAAVGQNIADFDIPEGYEMGGAMSIMGIDYVFIMPASPSPQEMMASLLTQFPASMATSQEQMEQQMKRAFQQQYYQEGVEMEVVETKTITIRGEDATQIISEGTGENGVTIRQLMLFFDGKGGLAALMVMGATSTWDQEAIDDFISSIR
jgi:hypothetical protein